VRVAVETAEQRARRERQRGLFDGIAGRYDATRASYPAEIVDAMLTTARVGRGAAVLEIGCGTGQLTRRLAGRGLDLTAIDIGAAMADAARRNVADPLVRFQATAFEDLANAGPFDLIVSATERSSRPALTSAWCGRPFWRWRRLPAHLGCADAVTAQRTPPAAGRARRG